MIPRPLKRRIYELLETAQPGDRPSAWFDRAMIALILLAVVVAVVGTMPEVADARRFLAFAEVGIVVAFTLEYLARLWAATEHDRRRYRSGLKGRLRLVVNPYMLVDLMAILPFWALLLVPIDSRYASLFPLLRIVRVLKLARYSSALDTLKNAIYTERRTLAGAMVVMAMLLLLASTAMYTLERDVQPDAFGSIPAAMWWGAVTLTTVGYGDVTPMTPLGRVFGAMVAVLGIGMFALPAGILANGFAQQLRQREFLVSWGLVARVPLFSHLNAAQIAEITRVLEPRTVQAGQIVLRRGEMAEEMFFIVSGDIEVEIEPPVRMSDGYFGEIALLQRTTRTATVRAVTRAKFLMLERRAFDRLLEDHPEIAATIHEEAQRRLAAG